MIVSRCDLRRLCGFLALACAIASPFFSGCAGNCATNCPVVVFEVFPPSGETLSLATAQWAGPACPAEPPRCLFNPYNTSGCAGFGMVGAAPGSCELDLTFSDGRAPYGVTVEFGEETHQGCCHGLPVTGVPTATIPPRYPASGTDAASDGSDGAGMNSEVGSKDAFDPTPSDGGGIDSPADSVNDGA